MRGYGLTTAEIVYRMHDRIGAMRNEIERSGWNPLAIELGEIAQHPAAETHSGKGCMCGGIDLFQRWAFRPFAARWCRLPVDGRRNDDRIGIETGRLHPARDLRCFGKRGLSTG